MPTLREAGFNLLLSEMNSSAACFCCSLNKKEKTHAGVGTYDCSTNSLLYFSPEEKLSQNFDNAEMN